MDQDNSPTYSRRTAMALAASCTFFPALAARAQPPAANALKGLDVGPITWRNIRTDFGAVGNGTSSDFVAFRAFRNWAMVQKGWVGLVIPPTSGHYVTRGPYSGNANGMPFFGIKRLVVSGYGATMDGLHGGALTNNPSIRHSIRSVKAGSRTVELIDRASVRFLSPGSMVLLAGFDLQGGWGYPPNNHFNEWHRIASIKEWRITFERPIRYDYRDDWPRYFEGNQHELGGIGPAAICRTTPEWDCEHRIYGLRAASSGQTYYFVRKAVLVDVKHDGLGWIIGASEDHRIIGQQHVGTNHEVDKLTTKALIEDYGPANKNILIQSSSVDQMEVRGGTRSINGTARHMLITGGERPYIRLGPVAYGISDEIVIKDAVVTEEIIGSPGMSVPLDKNLTYLGDGILRYTGKPLQWFVPGAVGIIRSAQPHYFDHYMFRILSVRSEDGQRRGPILIETSIKGRELPKVTGLENIALIRHNAPNLTVINCTGCPTAEELSMVPPNSPYGIFRRRTFDGSTSGQNFGYVAGRLVHMKINVVKPYTGEAPALSLRMGGQFGGSIIQPDRTWTRLRKSAAHVNLKVAGERIIKPTGVTGTQAGDANLDFYTGGIWMPGGYSFSGFMGDGERAVDISGEDPGVRPIVIVEALTNQEFE